MVKNIAEEVIIPESPKVIPNEQLNVYVPVASYTNKGIARFNSQHFTVTDGIVRISNDYMNSLLNKKVDKIPNTTRFDGVYTQGADGRSKLTFISASNMPSTLAFRDERGAIKVAYPVENNDAVSNGYLKNELDKLKNNVNNYTNAQVADAVTDVKGYTDTKVSEASKDASDNLDTVKQGLEQTINTGMSTLSGNLQSAKAALESSIETNVTQLSSAITQCGDNLTALETTLNARDEELQRADVIGFNIKPVSDDAGRYEFELKFNNSDENSNTLKAELDLPFEGLKIASIDDYFEDGKRYIKVTFVNGEFITTEFDDIFNIDDLKEPEISVGPTIPTGTESLWVDTASQGVAVVADPCDFESETINYTAPYVRFRIMGLNPEGEALSFRLIPEYYEDDVFWSTSTCNVEISTNDARIKCSVDVAGSYTPTHCVLDSPGEVSLYMRMPHTGSYRIKLDGLNRTMYPSVGGITYAMSCVDSIPDDAHKVNSLTLSASNVVSGVIADGIVRRNSKGEVLLKETSEYSSNAAVPKSYIASNYASKSKVALLEGALIDYVEDSDIAYVKKVPDGVSKKAVLQRVQAMRWAQGENFFDPNAFGVTPNDDGSVTLEYDFGEENYYTEYYAYIDLPRGHYYLTYDENRFGTVYGTSVYYAFVQSGEAEEVNQGEIVVSSDWATVAFIVYLDGVGVCGSTYKIMLSETDGASFVPYGQVKSILNSIRLVSPNELNYRTLVDSSYIIGDVIRTYDTITDLNVGADGFLSRLDLSGDEVTFTLSAKLKAYDSEGTQLEGVYPAYILFEDDSGNSMSVSLTEQGATETWYVNELPLYWHGTLVSDVPSDGYLEVSEIMLRQSAEKRPYVPFFEQKTLFALPSAIRDMANNCNTNCVIDFENKKVYMDGQPTDASSYLTDYEGFKLIDVVAGANLVFINSSSSDVQSTIVYVKPTGGA